MSKPRKSLSKKLRFEVFKRDSFTCQYCGNSAPEIVLQADHIEPHSKGGSDDITNLITSCVDCNSGKGARRLSDQSLMEKTKLQLAELQEKRNQLEMMMEWRKSLVAAKNDASQMAADYWNELAPGHFVNDNGMRNIRTWLKTFSFDEIIAAMAVAADAYLETHESGGVSNESWELGFSKIPGICRMNRLDKEQPEMREVYYIRGILRNRFNLSGYDQHRLIEQIREASTRLQIGAIKEKARTCKSIGAFEYAIAKVYTYPPAGDGKESRNA